MGGVLVAIIDSIGNVPVSVYLGKLLMVFDVINSVEQNNFLH